MLVFPPSSLNGVGMENSFIPNGILSIAGYLRLNLPEIEIKVVDGSVTNNEEIVDEIYNFTPDIVGLSVLLGNYKSAKILLSEAKKIGAITVLGNHHAKYLIKLLKYNPSFSLDNVDFLINGKRGEDSFLELIIAIEKGENTFNIPQVGVIDEGGFVFNKYPNKLKKLPDRIEPDLSFVNNFSKYFRAYSRIFKNFHNDVEIRPININFIEGCHQGCNEPCIYCCLKDHQMDYLHPEDYWERISLLIDKGFNYFFETCNSLSSLQYEIYNGSNYLECLSKTIPTNLKGKFGMMVYARANEINESSLKAFKEIGVHRVIFGFDSGDNTVLKTGIKKQGINSSDNIKAAKILDKEEIQTYACYVPGSKSETYESLENSYLQIQELLSLKNTSVIEFTSLAPMPGSIAWKEICKDYESLHGINDEINITDLAKTWIDLKVKNVSWELIQEYKYKIENLTISNNKVFGGYY